MFLAGFPFGAALPSWAATPVARSASTWPDCRGSGRPRARRGTFASSKENAPTMWSCSRRSCWSRTAWPGCSGRRRLRPASGPSWPRHRARDVRRSRRLRQANGSRRPASSGVRRDALVDGLLAEPVAVGGVDRRARPVDRQLVEVRAAQPGQLGVEVGEVAGLQQRVVGEVDAPGTRARCRTRPARSRRSSWSGCGSGSADR